MTFLFDNILTTRFEPANFFSLFVLCTSSSQRIFFPHFLYRQPNLELNVVGEHIFDDYLIYYWC